MSKSKEQMLVDLNSDLVLYNEKVQKSNKLKIQEHVAILEILYKAIYDIMSSLHSYLSESNFNSLETRRVLLSVIESIQEEISKYVAELRRENGTNSNYASYSIEFRQMFFIDSVDGINNIMSVFTLHGKSLKEMMETFDSEIPVDDECGDDFQEKLNAILSDSRKKMEEAVEAAQEKYKGLSVQF